MSRDFKKGVVAHFVARLNLAWATAAPASYVAVEKWAIEVRQRPGQPEGGPFVALPASTVNDLLTKERHRLPGWGTTFSLVVVFREMAAANGRDPDAVGTIEEWKARHEAALRELARASHGTAPAIDHGLDERRIAVEDAQRATLLAGARQPDAWWRRFQSVVPEDRGAYLTLERRAGRLRIHEPGGIPDLLQTEEVARRLAARQDPDASAGRIARVVDLQLRRQRFFQDSETARLQVLLDESALDRPPLPALGQAAWRNQLGHLLRLSRRPRVNVRIRRTTAAGVMACGPVRLLSFREPEFPDVVCLPEPNGARYPVESVVVRRYAAFLDDQFLAAASIDVLRTAFQRI